MTSDVIDFNHFQQVDIRVGTILSATLHPKSRQSAYILEVDFGPLGIKTTSAQLTQNYDVQTLVGRQIVAVVNFPAKRVAGVKSEVLVLAAVSEQSGTVLLQPCAPTENGNRVS